MSLFSMSVDKIVNGSNFVKEPVDQIINKINNSKQDRIVLTGPRCSGKSIVLQSYEKDLVESKNKGVYIFCDSATMSLGFTDEDLRINCEFHMCSWILNYIKSNYSLIYEKMFDEINQELKYKDRLFIKYINNSYYTGEQLKYELFKGDLLKRLIERMKEVLRFDTLTICLDRFDWVNAPNGSKFQEMMLFYFELFDKVILTSDDINVYNNVDGKRDKLISNGYDVIDVDYGKNIDVTKKIVSADLKYYAKNKREFHLDNIQFVDLKYLLDEDKYNYLIQKCNGNFELLYATLRKFYLYNDIDNEDNINKIIEHYYEDSLRNKERVDELSYKRVLHL